MYCSPSFLITPSHSFLFSIFPQYSQSFKFSILHHFPLLPFISFCSLSVLIIAIHSLLYSIIPIHSLLLSIIPHYSHLFELSVLHHFSLLPFILFCSLSFHIIPSPSNPPFSIIYRYSHSFSSVLYHSTFIPSPLNSLLTITPHYSHSILSVLRHSPLFPFIPFFSAIPH